MFYRRPYKTDFTIDMLKLALPVLSNLTFWGMEFDNLNYSGSGIARSNFGDENQIYSGMPYPHKCYFPHLVFMQCKECVFGD